MLMKIVSNSHSVLNMKASRQLMSFRYINNFMAEVCLNVVKTEVSVVKCAVKLVVKFFSF